LKWDKSIHANLSAETVPAAESRASIGFATWRATIDQRRRTKSMHENGATHPSSAPTICYTNRKFTQGATAMLNAKFFEEMSSKLNEAVANSPARDFEKNARALLAQGFAKLDLVTREEYDVLAQRLERLEARLAALEAKN
jgi:BMFP domain-containing protein YqiC